MGSEKVYFSWIWWSLPKVNPRFGSPTGSVDEGCLGDFLGFENSKVWEFGSLEAQMFATMGHNILGELRLFRRSVILLPIKYQTTVTLAERGKLPALVHCFFLACKLSRACRSVSSNYLLWETCFGWDDVTGSGLNRHTLSKRARNEGCIYHHQHLYE